MDPTNMESFRATDRSDLRPRKSKRPPRHPAGQWFLKGPIPGLWIHQAAKLPGRALHVGLAIWYASGVSKRRKVKLEKFHLDRFGVGYYAGRRGLKRLELAGLVTVDRHPGRRPVVTIQDAPISETDT
jgi:hypothetical protein